MRKILSSFLMLVMVAATMMCFCAPEAKAGISQVSHTHAGHQTGHGHDKGDAPECKGADMQLPQQASVSAPDLKNSLHFDVTFASDASTCIPLRAVDSAICGPPPDWPRHAQDQSSIFLTTKRLRI